MSWLVTRPDLSLITVLDRRPTKRWVVKGGGRSRRGTAARLCDGRRVRPEQHQAGRWQDQGGRQNSDFLVEGILS